MRYAILLCLAITGGCAQYPVLSAMGHGALQGALQAYLGPAGLTEQQRLVLRDACVLRSLTVIEQATADAHTPELDDVCKKIVTSGT